MCSVARVCEFHKGLRGEGYHYVIEGAKLIHISRYAVSREEVGDFLCYRVDLAKL